MMVQYQGTLKYMCFPYLHLSKSAKLFHCTRYGHILVILEY